MVRASMHSNESMHQHQTWTPHHPSPNTNTPILPLPPKMTPNSSRSRPTLNRHPLNKLALAFPSAATLPTESFPRLATQFLPTDFLLALHRASSVHGPLTVPLPYWLPTNQPTPPTLPSLPDGSSQKATQKRLISEISLFSLVFKRRATGEKAPSSAYRESAKSALFL